MGSCAAPSAKGDDKFITTDYLQQCRTVGPAFDSTVRILPDIGVLSDVLKRGVRNIQVCVSIRFGPSPFLILVLLLTGKPKTSYQKNSSSIK
uniref:hypothetical protein n=1 Tax=Proteus vulgaris TaxID=585 RepID=UPI0009E9F568|nr:hypothetical protein [Proteus vulgaris]